MTRNIKLTAGLLLAAAVAIGTVVFLNRPQTPPPAADSPVGTATAVADSMLIRSDSHILSSAADGKVTVVEFLDLECEACGAAYPMVERLRAEYAGRVTFVMRYFPIPSHVNAELAAQAVEAAGQQGQLEPMYQKMYQTQASWGDQQVSHRQTFIGFAEELGLDLAAFESALDAPATRERVLADRADGTALGVQGTPTFFVNGEMLQGAPGYEGFKAILDQALADD